MELFPLPFIYDWKDPKCPVCDKKFIAFTFRCKDHFEASHCLIYHFSPNHWIRSNGDRETLDTKMSGKGGDRIVQSSIIWKQPFYSVPEFIRFCEEYCDNGIML